MLIKENDTVLFQGDSITDAGRDKGDPHHLGWGYAMMAAAWFSALFPEKNVRFINRGISGNRVKDLKHRWQEECLDLKPNVISILIGINDCWRRYDRNDPTTSQHYEEDYRSILTQIKEKLAATIIILEPFVLPVPEDRKEWRKDLDPKIQVARALAREFGALYVPLDGIFAAASITKEPSFWAHDGVHPSAAGHALIAQNWLKAVGLD